MYRFLGEFDCEADLGAWIGMEAASKVYKGKLNYFQNLNSGEVFGVDKWEDLPGKYIRFEDNGWGSKTTKIGNIIADKWFDLKEFFGKAMD